MIEFFLESYRSNRVAFYFEMISLIIYVFATLALMITAANPNMTILYPIYTIAGLASCISTYRRKLIWPLTLSIFLVITDIIGFFISLS